MSKLRIAIAGLGASARTIHLPAYAKLPRLQVVGGADPCVSDVGLGFPVFPTAEQMLEKVKPDILTVATPPASHFDLTRLGLEAGCHVFCEKPFMTTIEQADAIVSLAEQAGRRVVVNNQYRYMNIHRAAKDCIGHPEFGELLFVNAQQSFYRTETTEAGWRGEDAHRTCKEFGTHVFDLCRFFFDEDPLAIMARMPKPDKPDGPDYLNLVLLEFSGDRVAQVTLDRLCRGPHDYLSIRLDGTSGFLQTQLGGGVELRAGVRGGTRTPFLNVDVSMGGRARLYHGEKFRKIAADPLNIFANATGQLLRAFLGALDRDQVPPCDAKDNRRTLALMLAACQSAESNEKITLDYGSHFMSISSSNEANTIR